MTESIKANQIKDPVIAQIVQNELSAVYSLLSKVAAQRAKNRFSKHNSISAWFPNLLVQTRIELERQGYHVTHFKGYSIFGFHFGSGYSVRA